MNMKTDLVNRALYAAGRKLLADDGAAESKALRGVCLGAYLQTFLEALSEAPWTGGKLRKRLMKTMLPHSDAGYARAYDLPWDCARPIELSNKGMFVIEGRLLHTDEENAELLYVTSGAGLPDAASIQAPVPGGHCSMFLSPGGPGEWGLPVDETIYPGRPGDLPWHGPRLDAEGNEEGERVPENWDRITPVPFPDDPEPDEDYPGCRPPEYEPKFYEYVEKMLAAKFAAAENQRARAVLLQEAALIKQQALDASRSAAKARQQPGAWWADKLRGGR